MEVSQKLEKFIREVLIVWLDLERLVRAAQISVLEANLRGKYIPLGRRGQHPARKGYMMSFKLDFGPPDTT